MPLCMIEFLAFLYLFFRWGCASCILVSSDCVFATMPVAAAGNERRHYSGGTGAGPWKPVRVGYVRAIQRRPAKNAGALSTCHVSLRQSPTVSKKSKPKPSADLIRVANPANLSWPRQAGLRARGPPLSMDRHYRNRCG